MTIEDQIKELDRETLETKFISMFKQLQEFKEKESQINIPVALKDENYIDFTKHKIKRRQQYLHKTYTKNPTALNYLLSELLNTRDVNLQTYFNNLHKELEEQALENHDAQLKDNTK